STAPSTRPRRLSRTTRNLRVSSSTNPVETLQELETLFALMRTFKVAICELPGGLKVVLQPEVEQPPMRQPKQPESTPARGRQVHDDPFLYSDGEVPSFERR